MHKKTRKKTKIALKSGAFVYIVATMRMVQVMFLIRRIQTKGPHFLAIITSSAIAVDKSLFTRFVALVHV